MVEMVALLAAGQEYPMCVSSKLMTYALGRTMSGEEHCVLADIGAQTVTPDSTLSDLLWAVVTSDAFQMEEIAENE